MDTSLGSDSFTILVRMIHDCDYAYRLMYGCDTNGILSSQRLHSRDPTVKVQLKIRIQSSFIKTSSEHELICSCD
jgi:hypothetical protein